MITGVFTEAVRAGAFVCSGFVSQAVCRSMFYTVHGGVCDRSSDVAEIFFILIIVFIYNV